MFSRRKPSRSCLSDIEQYFQQPPPQFLDLELAVCWILECLLKDDNYPSGLLQKLLQQSGWIVVVLEQAFQNPADSQFQVEKLRWGLLEVLLDIGQTGARRLAAGKHDNVDTESIKVDLIVRFKGQFLDLPKPPN